MVGLEQRYRRKPEGPTDERYSSQIIDDLIEEARNANDPAVAPVLTLFVDPANAAAIKLYRRSGFSLYEHSYFDKISGIVYQGMLLTL